MYIVDSFKGWMDPTPCCLPGGYNAQVAELLLQAGASVEQAGKVRWSVGQNCVGELSSTHIPQAPSPPQPLPLHPTESKHGRDYIQLVLSICP